MLRVARADGRPRGGDARGRARRRADRRPARARLRAARGPRSAARRSRWRSTSCRCSRSPAASPTGTTTIRDAAELRRKESDRIATVTAALAALGGARRGDRGRDRGRGHGRPARGAGLLARRPPHRDARRGRRPRLAGGGRGRGDGGRRGQLPAASRPTSPGAARGAPPEARPHTLPAWSSPSTVPPGRASPRSPAPLAAELGFTYLDSGAMYRCVALATLEAGADPDDAAAVSAIAADLEIELESGRVLLGGRDVSARIREPEVTAAASRVSVHPAVREAMVARQRALIGAGRYVAEGRDIGTVVSPRGAAEGLPHRLRGGAGAAARRRRPARAPRRCSPPSAAATRATPAAATAPCGSPPTRSRSTPPASARAGGRPDRRPGARAGAGMSAARAGVDRRLPAPKARRESLS